MLVMEGGVPMGLELFHFQRLLRAGDLQRAY